MKPRRIKCLRCRGLGYIEVQDDREERAERLLESAAEDWKISVAELCGPWRKREVVEARKYVARELRRMGLSLKEIGILLGGRDHSTVINLLKHAD